jgi:nucleoside-diphosphate kinase
MFKPANSFRFAGKMARYFVDILREILKKAPGSQKIMEQSLVILKPDCIAGGLIGRVIGRFEDAGMRIVASRVVTLDKNLLKEHYMHLAHLPFFPEIEEFMESSPVMVMVLEGNNAIERVRNILGPTDSQKAPAGTIRGDLGMDKMRNIAHASDSKESATAEIARFFRDSM